MLKAILERLLNMDIDHQEWYDFIIHGVFVATVVCSIIILFSLVLYTIIPR